MKKAEKIILIDNYAPDKQESMLRFTDMLRSSFVEQGKTVKVISPVAVFGKFVKSTVGGYGKWLGYIDKWVLFPVALLFIKLFNNSALFHICDHSNAPYVSFLPRKRTSVTCHDVLAIRGALGFADAYCPASRAGKVLQNWILKNLLKAEKIAAVSQLTLNQLTALNNGITKPGWQLIHNGFNADFVKLTPPEWQAMLNDNGLNVLTATPYIVHVGSDLPRKNRQMLLSMVAALGDKWNGNICFSGYLMDEQLKKQAELLGLMHRVVEVKRPSHALLQSIINGAEAFIFPSFSEGFGWPVIEAQACGTPVIASSLQPMPEVGGDGGLYADPYKPEEFAACLLSLQDENLKAQLTEKGFKNISRFDTALMTERYFNFFQMNHG